MTIDEIDAQIETLGRIKADAEQREAEASRKPDQRDIDAENAELRGTYEVRWGAVYAAGVKHERINFARFTRDTLSLNRTLKDEIARLDHALESAPRASVAASNLPTPAPSPSTPAAARVTAPATGYTRHSALCQAAIEQNGSPGVRWEADNNEAAERGELREVSSRTEISHAAPREIGRGPTPTPTTGAATAQEPVNYHRLCIAAKAEEGQQAAQKDANRAEVGKRLVTAEEARKMTWHQKCELAAQGVRIQLDDGRII